MVIGWQMEQRKHLRDPQCCTVDLYTESRAIAVSPASWWLASTQWSYQFTSKDFLSILKALHTLKHSLIWQIMLPSYTWLVQICLQTFNTAEHIGSWVFSLNSTTIACIPSASIDWSHSIPSCRSLKGSGNRSSSGPATGTFKVGAGGSYNL